MHTRPKFKDIIFFVIALYAQLYISETQLHPLALDVMASLDSQWFVAVAAFGNTSSLLAMHIAQLPKPVWLWTHIGGKSCQLLKFVLENEEQLPNVAIFLPWRFNLPKDFVARLDYFAHISAQTHWVITTAENESLGWVKTLGMGACQVVTVSPSSIEEPVNGFVNCNVQRRNTSAVSMVLKLRGGDPKKFPANLKLKIVQPYRVENDGRIDVYPEVAAVLEAYSTINTTLNLIGRFEGGNGDVLVLYRFADIDIVPTPFFGTFKTRFYLHAMYPPCQLCFFTRRVQVKGSSVLKGLASNTMFISIIASVALLVVLIYRHLECIETRSRASAIVLFLTSTFFGRAPRNIPSSTISAKILLASWVFGTFFVGSYLQSHITADMHAPTFAREVESMDELQKLMDNGDVLPCIDYSMVSVVSNINGSKFSEKLTSLVHSRLDDCVSNDAIKTCCRLGRPGKRVCIRPCCGYDVFIAHQHGLVKGRGNVHMYQRVSTMLRNFPQRRQHRRLLLAVSESGMDFYQDRKAGILHPEEGVIIMKYPFSNYLCAFAVGCAAATLAFCLELLWVRTTRK